MKGWARRALVSLFVAVACAKATDEDLIPSGEDDSGGMSGTGASPFGGASGFSGSASGGKGGTTTGGTSGKGGAGGTSGEGGAPTGGTSGNDGGASDGGEGGTDPCIPPETQPDLRIEYKADARAIPEDPSGQFHIVNGTAEPVPMSELKARYWFHSEFTCAETTDAVLVMVVTFQFQTPFVNKNIPDVTTTYVSLGSGAPGCDGYFELGFDTGAGALEANQYALIGYFMQVPIYTRPHDQSNDYSYGACTMAPVYFDRVTLHRSGRLISGTPPDGAGGGEGGAGGEGGSGTGGV